MPSLTSFQSILMQCVSNCRFLGNLYQSNFLQSSFYQKSMPNFANTSRAVLNTSGIGNPAMLQAMLYMLLEIPREAMRNESKSTNNYFEDEYKKINVYIDANKSSCTSSYPTDSDVSTFSNRSPVFCANGTTIYSSLNYVRHIRNSIAHSKVTYTNTHPAVFLFNDEDCCRHTCSFEFDVNTLEAVIQKLDAVNCIYIANNVPTSTGAPYTM